MHTVRRLLLALTVPLVWQLTPASAFHEPGHIPPTGTCRDPACMQPPRDNAKKGKAKDPPGNEKKKCDKSLMEEYERKKKVGLELWKHRGELNLDAHREVGEFLGMEANRYGQDVATDIAVDKGWEVGSNIAKTYMKGERAAWVAKLAQYGGAAEAGMIIGGYLTFVDGAYRAYDISGRYKAYQKESRRAAEEAERLLREALEAFEAALKQAPECLEESRKAAADEKLLDKAKEQIEEWETNGYLYFDPIKKEAVVYEQALKRAKARLQGGSSRHPMEHSIHLVLFLAGKDGEVSVSKTNLEAAIKDLDEAIRSFNSLSPQMASYLRWQEEIHAKLDGLGRQLTK
jgi:tetratricopeptide (TPR) repeat protein